MDRPYIVKWEAGQKELHAASEAEALQVALKYVQFTAKLKAQAVSPLYEIEPKQ